MTTSHHGLLATFLYSKNFLAGFETFIVGVYDILVHVVWNEPVLLKMLGIRGPGFFN